MRDRYPDADVQLMESGSGAFEVRRDRELIFSKHKSGRFPEEAEILAALDR